MKLAILQPAFSERITVFYSAMIRLLLNLLLIVTILALAVGVGKSGVDLWHSLHQQLEVVLENMLLDIVFIVALVEITITILGYLREGRVHVRYIIDTILIIMLNEVVNLWFKHPKLEEIVGLAIILLVLAAIRIGALTVSDDKPGTGIEKPGT